MKRIPSITPLSFLILALSCHLPTYANKLPCLEEQIIAKGNKVNLWGQLKKEVLKDVDARESHRSHWATAISRHFSARSVHVYPTRIPVTSPARVFQFWIYLMSWAVCEKCGRRDASLWKTPTISGLTWTLPIPKIDGMTCNHHALWYHPPLLPTGYVMRS